MRYKCLICGHEWESRADQPLERQCSNCRRKRIIEAYKWDEAVRRAKDLLQAKPDIQVPIRALDSLLAVENKTSPIASLRSFLEGEIDGLFDPLLGFKIGCDILNQAQKELRKEKEGKVS